MKGKDNILIRTIPERCKMCYTCVRDCPAKAIRIQNGQAEVLPERCIACGNCILVCSQKAKEFYNSIDEVKALLKSDFKKIAILAPSFPASFNYIHEGYLIDVLKKKLGFNLVCEVAFGADLVAFQYRKLIEEHPDKCFIATTCPGVVSYVEKYYPRLVNVLAPIVSPMIAAGRAMKIIYGMDSKIVFIGPCFAKKEEAAKYVGKTKVDPIDSVLTFVELKQMISEIDYTFTELEDQDFDPPKAGLGALFPLRGGMLQAAEMRENLMESKIQTADGKDDFLQAIKEFEVEFYGANLLEVLCCKGCIMGAGMGTSEPYFARKTAVSSYIKSHKREEESKKNQELFKTLLDRGLDMNATFKASDIRTHAPGNDILTSIMHKMGKFKEEDELNCGACGYKTCREHAAAISSGLAENEMCLPYTIDRLKKSLNELKDSKGEIAKIQDALFNAEKLASMGQLSAGIAHEINNPLGVILLYTNILLEEISSKDELKDYKDDLSLIVEQANRCKNIVSGLLNFARINKIVREPNNIENLIDSSLRSVMKPDNIEIKINCRFTDPIAEVEGEKIIQVLVNLIKNSIDAMPSGGVINISAYDKGNEVYIKVKDNGHGVGENDINRVFEPFFTTKSMGKGTGLGLAVSYGIIKMHKGNISIISNADPSKGPTGSEITIMILRKEDEY